MTESESPIQGYDVIGKRKRTLHVVSQLHSLLGPVRFKKSQAENTHCRFRDFNWQKQNERLVEV